MAAESRESQEQREERAAMKAHADATEWEACQYWGYLLQEDKTGTPKLDRLLRGIAEVISRKFEPSDSPDLTPSQIAAWYRSVGGDYDLLFTETPPSSVAFIYRSLGAFHSLQPGPGDDGYSTPSIPALKKQGFVTWQTIQILLGPEEHVPFLQRAVELDDIHDPETGNIFPKVLPRQCFPSKPDEAMEAWYENVADRLKREADEESRGESVPDEPRLRTSTEGESSADEKTGAYRYFEDPLYRNGRPRPTFMRHVSKESTRPEYDHIGAVTSRVRHMLNPLNPFAGKKKSVPGRYESDSYSDDDATPIATVPNPGHRYPSHKRPPAPRRESSLSTTESESDVDEAPSRRRTPSLRAHRSQDPPVPQSGYFPTYPETRRYSNQHDAVRLEGRGSKATSPQPVYRPTTSPLFATQVAHAQQEAARKYYEPRPALPPRTSYRPVPAPHSVRYGPTSVHPVSPPREGAPHIRERERERDRHHRRDRDAYSMGSGSSGRSRRRHSTDVEYPRERDRDTARTRSHDRVKEDWDDEDGHSRDRDRDRKSRYENRGRVRDDSRDRTREARTHRYVSGVQDGGGGGGGAGSSSSSSGRKHAVVSGPSY